MNPSICILGAGAVGLDLAWQCIRAGFQVTIIARGATYQALSSVGIVSEATEKGVIPPTEFKVVSDGLNAGIQEIVFVTTKVDNLRDASREVGPLLSSNSVVISATNGIPPWYSYLQEATIGRFAFPLEPRTEFLRNIPGASLIGGIVERSCELMAPGVLKRAQGKGYTIGELDHSCTERCKKVQEILGRAGFTVSMSEDIHRDIWLKLIGNVAVNPLSVLTELNIGEMISDETTCQRMVAAAKEAELVGIRIGVIRAGDFNIEKFLSIMSEKLGTHRPSMLQDFDKGRPLELPRILGVVDMLAKAPGPIAPVECPIITELRNDIGRKLEGVKVVNLSP